MKKRLLLLVVLFSLVLCTQVQVLGAIDEQVVDTWLQQTYFTKMIFQGSSAFWKCSYVVETPVKASDDYSPNIKVNLTPQFNWADDELWKFKIKIYTSNGNIVQTRYIRRKENSINFNVTAPIPTSDEIIRVTIEWNYSNANKIDTINLTNIMPKNIISAEQAFKSFLKELEKISTSVPYEQYTFAVSYEDKYWFVIFDDNDDIGGQGAAAIDPYTGYVESIKIEE